MCRIDNKVDLCKSLADGKDGIRASYADKVRGKKRHEAVLVIMPKNKGQTNDKTMETRRRN